MPGLYIIDAGILFSTKSQAIYNMKLYYNFDKRRQGAIKSLKCPKTRFFELILVALIVHGINKTIVKHPYKCLAII